MASEQLRVNIVLPEVIAAITDKGSLTGSWQIILITREERTTTRTPFTRKMRSEVERRPRATVSSKSAGFLKFETRLKIGPGFLFLPAYANKSICCRAAICYRQHEHKKPGSSPRTAWHPKHAAVSALCTGQAH